MIFAQAGPVIPNFGGGNSANSCESANHLFCTDWFTRNWSGVLWPALGSQPQRGGELAQSAHSDGGWSARRQVWHR